MTKYDMVRDTMMGGVLRGYGGDNKENQVVAHYLCADLLNALEGHVGFGNQNAVKAVLSSTEWESPPMSPAEVQEKYGDGIDPLTRQDHIEGQFRVEMDAEGTMLPVYDRDQYKQIVDWLKTL